MAEPRWGAATYPRRWLLIFLIVITTVGCDQTTKAVASQWLAGRGTLHFLSDTVRFVLTHNEGAFMSLGAALGEEVRLALLVGGVGLMLGGLLVYLVVGEGLEPLPVVALSLVVGGGLGNLIDRLRYDGAVVDFVNVGIGGLRTATFNVADVVVFGGVGMLLLLSLRAEQPPTATESE